MHAVDFACRGYICGTASTCAMVPEKARSNRCAKGQARIGFAHIRHQMQEPLRVSTLSTREVDPLGCDRRHCPVRASEAPVRAKEVAAGQNPG